MQVQRDNAIIVRAEARYSPSTGPIASPVGFQSETQLRAGEQRQARCTSAIPSPNGARDPLAIASRMRCFQDVVCVPLPAAYENGSHTASGERMGRTVPIPSARLMAYRCSAKAEMLAPDGRDTRA
jgi:hypothetical protein